MVGYGAGLTTLGYRAVVGPPRTVVSAVEAVAPAAGTTLQMEEIG
jgi:hypothetical protein